MKRFITLGAAFLALCFMLSSCITPTGSTNDNNSAAGGTPDSTQGGGSQEASGDSSGEASQDLSVKGEAIAVYNYSKDLAAAEYSSAGATLITLDDAGSKVSGSGAVVSGSTVTVQAAGVYILSGSLSDGQIIVDATKDDHVKLVLDGVSISCTYSAPIYSKQADKTIVILADNSENSLTDAAEYVYADGEDEPDAALFSKDDLTLAGSGKLTVNANYRNGIGTKDDLCILSGTYIVTAPHDALRGKDCLAVCGGTFVFSAGNDGMKSNNDTDAEAGYVVIDGGDFTIQSGHDGIEAADALTINGGVIRITTGEGSAAAPVRAGDNFGGMGGGRNPWQNGVNPETPAADTSETDDGTSDSYKGLKSEFALQITGGTITIDSYEDAIHSNTKVIVTGGLISLQAGDDGIHGDDNVTVNGGEIAIGRCYEGIESATIDIHGGSISITASDDGLNASDGSGTVMGGMGGFGGGGNSALYIRISGGNLAIDAAADGIDSNGNMYLDGGTVYVIGSSDPESAIDADGTIIVSGGTVVGIGSVGHMEAPTEDSTQPTLMVIFSSQQAAQTMLKLTNQDGEVIYEGSSSKAFQSFFFTDPALLQGENYTLSVNGQETATIPLTTMLTICSETGEAVSSSGFGGMGGGAGGGMPGGAWGGMGGGRR